MDLTKIVKKDKIIPLPENIEMIFISPWGDVPHSCDEQCTLAESVEMIAAIGRGFLIVDKTQRADKKIGRLAHDMDNLKPETFLKLVNPLWFPTSQISVLS